MPCVYNAISFTLHAIKLNQTHSLGLHLHLRHLLNGAIHLLLENRNLLVLLFPESLDRRVLAIEFAKKVVDLNLFALDN